MKPLGSIVYGFGIWAVATLAFRLFGQIFFRVEIGWVAVLLAAASTPTIAALTLAGFGVLRIPPAQRPAAASAFVATGMVLDAIAIFWWGVSYPNMTAASARPFGAFMLWCNAIALIVGVLASRASSTEPR